MSSDLAMDRISFLIQGIEAVGSEQGMGDPILFIHGWGGGSSNWRRVWPMLAPRSRCLAPDLPGWGDSEKPRVPYTFEWYADWLADLMEARRASPAHLVGHSMGAAIAVTLALRHPARVRSLALINPVLRGSDGVKFESRFLSGPVIRHLSYLCTRSKAFLRFLTRNFTAAEDGLDENDLLLVGKGTFASMTRSLTALKKVDLSESLKSITVPSLVIGSDLDREIPPAQAALAGTIPGARVEMLKGCGHVSPLERPAEVAALLIDFYKFGPRRGRPPQW